MSARQGAACVVIVVAVAAGAFALGAATAPDASPAGAPAVEGPSGGIEVPPLGKVAALPPLSEEAPAPVVEVESEEGGSAVTEAPVTEAPVTEAPPPVEEAPASPTPEAAPAPSGESEEVVPEGI